MAGVFRRPWFHGTGRRRGALAWLGYAPNLETGVEFDGSADWLERTSDLSGNADGKNGTLALLLKPDNGTRHLYYSSRFNVTLASGALTIEGKNASDTTILSVSSTTLATGTWHAIMASWDLLNGTAAIYRRDADITNGTPTTTNDTIDYTTATHHVGANVLGASLYDGCMNELFLSREHVDFTVQATRRDFFDASGNPQAKGSDGSGPTGTAPIVYLSGPAAQFERNFGSGGAFNVNGALADCAVPTFAPAMIRSSLMLMGVGA